MGIESEHDRLPDGVSAFVLPTMWTVHGSHARSQFKPIQNNGTCFGHRGLCLRDRCVELPGRRLDQQSVVDGHTNSDAVLSCLTARQALHFSAIGLHWKIAHATWGHPRLSFASRTPSGFRR